MRGIVVVILFLIVGPIFMLKGCKEITTSITSKGWPTVEGQVVSVEVEQRRGRWGGTSYRPVVQYSYEVDQKKYRSEQIRSGDTSSGNMSDVIMEAASYEDREDLKVYYDEDDPSQAFLDPGGNWTNWIPVLIGLVMTTVGGFGLKRFWEFLKSDDYSSGHDAGFFGR